MTMNNDKSSMPGQLLLTQRETLNLSAMDVAKKTRLHIDFIKAIEADQYDKLPLPIYVRGYLRSYAKVISADADHVIALYNQNVSLSAQETTTEITRLAQKTEGSHEKPVKVLIYLASFSLILLLLIWYQSDSVVKKEVISDAEALFEPDNNQIDAPPQPIDSGSFEDDALILSKTIMPSNEQQLDVTMTPLPAQPNIDDVGDSDDIASKEDEHDSILLTLTNDSWIEIYDVDGNYLFYDLGRAGEQYSVNGKAPFRVQLGFSDGVQITLNGKIFDHSSYAKNNLANFTLPAK